MSGLCLAHLLPSLLCRIGELGFLNSICIVLVFNIFWSQSVKYLLSIPGVGARVAVRSNQRLCKNSDRLRPWDGCAGNSKCERNRSGQLVCGGGPQWLGDGGGEGGEGGEQDCRHPASRRDHLLQVFLN